MIVARLRTVLFGLLVAFWAGTAFAGTEVPIAVPEPTSLVLLASGIAGVAWLKFRRRRK